MKGILIVFSLLILLGSCTIEKRLHNPGYNIQWSKVNRKSIHKSQDVSELRESNVNLAELSDQQLVIHEQMFIESVDTIIPFQTSAEIETEEVVTNIVRQKTPISFSSAITSNYNLKNPNKRAVHYKGSEMMDRDIDWELIGTIAFGILILVVFGIALLGTGTLATIASILIAIGYAILLIAAIVCICWFLWFIFFGWWLR